MALKPGRRGAALVKFVLGAVTGIVLVVAVTLVLRSHPGVPPYTVESRETAIQTQEYGAEALVVSTPETGTQELGKIAQVVAREDLAYVDFRTPEGAPIADAWTITTQAGYDNFGEYLPPDADPVGKDLPYVYVLHRSEE
jgi:hypothetical protein